MMDDARHGRAEDGEFIEFALAGAPVDGPYRCSGCGYGVTVRTALPRCPMCAGETWEPAATQQPDRHRLL